MSIPHFFIEERIEGKAGDTVGLSLPQDICDHMHTLRLRARERVILTDAPGHGWELELATLPSRHLPHLEATLIREHMSALPPALTLIQGISAANRMDQTIRQTTELGVARIIPLESERSTVRLDTATRAVKHERWRKVARGAAEQSGQLVLPTVESPCGLSAALAMVEGYDALVFFWEEPGGRSLSEVLSEALEGAHTGVPQHRQQHRHVCGDALGEAPDADLSSEEDEGRYARPRVAAFIGPEGGFSEQEATHIKAAGGWTVTLGDTILRTETAAVVACALILHHLGALGASGSCETVGAPAARGSHGTAGAPDVSRSYEIAEAPDAR
jgi:16S rRNA (uracil1498-N3)-methyltransferase